jgi:PPOX class probable F420-dependent enzyme
MPILTPDVRALLDAPNYVHVATLMPDGSPHSVAVWALPEDDNVVFFTQPESRKAKNIEQDPRVALSVIDRTNPYRTGRLRGEVIETRTGDEALVTIDRLSQSYTGKPFPMRSGIVFVVEPRSVGFMELPFEDGAATA